MKGKFAEIARKDTSSNVDEVPAAWCAAGTFRVPELVALAGPVAQRRYVEFFVATIRNSHTRRNYAHAVDRFFRWMEQRGLTLHQMESLHVATYVEVMLKQLAPPTVKLHLAAIRMCLDWMVSGGQMSVNPSWSVRGPKHVVRRGKTPVLSREQARQLLDSFDVSTIAGLRDRALVAVMIFTFARVRAVVRLNVGDYWQNGKRWWLRLHEKGGKFHEVPAHHLVEAYLDAYLQAADISGQLEGPLFRTLLKRRTSLSLNRMNPNDVLRVVKRQAILVGLPRGTCCHTFRATGITAFLENGGTIEKAQAIAAHESPRTTKLYDRRSDELSLDEIERILI